MIQLKALQHRLLHIPELLIGRGRTAIIGPNGAGKTMLLRLCAGIDLPAAGEVSIDGRTPRECEIGWVGEYPDRSLVFERVQDEIASPLRFCHMPCREIARRVEGIAELLCVRHLLDRRTGELSTGEKVMVALATALVNAPEVLILDEFDSHVDIWTQETVFHAVERMNIPYILHATHQMEYAWGADMVVYMEDGVVQQAGPPGEVFRALRGTCHSPLYWGA